MGAFAPSCSAQVSTEGRFACLSIQMTTVRKGDSAMVVQRQSARRYMTVKEICDELGVARSTLYDWRAAHKGPPCLKLPNGDLRVKRTDFERWLESLEGPA